ncbi:porin [Aliivibrio fischeri]|uniref:porin n=1 Tax=Aliivibrio fischeri TaxID=668 RepID=UPI0007C4569E|nr:porin [Aliivibrio fischeri]MUK91389.1 porin [Aliivibrio fischeri]TGA70077.1 porin [Aliivibrio fischeri]
MKKTLLALAVPALLMAGSASAATVYTAEDGSTIDVYSRLGFNITDRAGMGEDGDAVGNFDARIGLGGSQVVNDKVSVIGWAEYSVGAAEQRGTDNSFTPRYVWAGIDASEAGKVTFGRVASGIIMLSDVGDVFAASDVVLGRQLELVDNSAAQTFRQDGTIQYQNSFGAFDMSVAYILGNSESNQDGSYNAAARYTFDMGDAGQLIPIAAYQANSTGDTGSNANRDYTFWGAGLQYKLNALTLGAMYNQDEIEGQGISGTSKDKSYELTAVYNINDDWTARAGYRALENTGGDETEYKDTTLEVQYHLTERSSIYTSYVMRNGENGTGLGTPAVMTWNNAEEDYYHLGLRYEF